MTDPHAAIPQLIYRYARALDRLDAELLGEVFAPDAAITLGAIFTGDPAGFVPVMQAFMGSMAATRHEVSNILIELEPGGDAARVESYVVAWHLLRDGDAARELIVRARYVSRGEHRPEGWRLTAHAEVLDWGALTPADPAWHDANLELPKGRRDRRDLSYG